MNLYVALLVWPDRYSDPILVGVFSSEAGAQQACQHIEDEDPDGETALGWGDPITPEKTYTRAETDEGCEYVIQLAVLDLAAHGLEPADPGQS